MPYPGHSLGRVLTLCKEAVGVFYSSSRLGEGGCEKMMIIIIITIVIIKKKTENLPSGEFCRPGGPQNKNQGKRKKNLPKKKKKKKKRKKLWNMKVTVLPMVTSALGTVSTSLVRGPEKLDIEVRAETIHTTAVLKSTRILRRVLETCCHSDSSERPSTNAVVKNS